MFQDKYGNPRWKAWRRRFYGRAFVYCCFLIRDCKSKRAKDFWKRWADWFDAKYWYYMNREVPK